MGFGKSSFGESGYSKSGFAELGLNSFSSYIIDGTLEAESKVPSGGTLASVDAWIVGHFTVIFCKSLVVCCYLKCNLSESCCRDQLRQLLHGRHYG